MHFRRSHLSRFFIQEKEKAQVSKTPGLSLFERYTSFHLPDVVGLEELGEVVILLLSADLSELE